MLCVGPGPIPWNGVGPMVSNFLRLVLMHAGEAIVEG